MELESLKRKNTFLIVIIILLVIALVVLGLYTFLKDDKKEEQIVNEKEELTNSEMALITENLPFNELLDNKNLTVSDLTKEQILLIGYYGLKESSKVEGDISSAECFDNLASDFIDTPNTSQQETAECIAQVLGLSDTDINNMDTTLWNHMIGESTGYTMFSVDSINKIVEDRLGLSNQFVESFNESLNLGCGNLNFVYDKNVNSFFEHSSGGCTLGDVPIIYLDSGYILGDTYTINIVEGIFTPYEQGNDTKYNLHSKSNNINVLTESIDYTAYGAVTSEMKELVKQYSDQLDKYEITFKKNGDTYQFINLRTVE